MKDIIPAKKQSPILGLTGMGGGVSGNLGGSLDKKTFVEDVFSTYLYTGTGSSQAINNAVDLSGDGGLTWIKSRSHAEHHWLFDTVNGADWSLNSDRSNARYNTGGPYLSSFNNNGFTVGSHDGTNGSSKEYTSWSFRKAPGFFDIVQYTGNGTGNHQISHDLGSVPGMIMIKCTSTTHDWMVYHVGTTDPAGPGGEYLRLNEHDPAIGSSGGFYNTTATSTYFTLGDSDIGNQNGSTYIAYVFAGGESTAATARSVDFDGSGDYLSIAASDDLNLTDEFTIEAWVKVDDDGWSGTRRTLLANSTGWATNHAAVSLMNSNQSNEENTIILYNNQSTIADSSPVRIKPSDGWTHIAIARDSGNDIRIFKNGIQAGSTATYSGDFKFGLGETWIGAITMSTGATPEVLDGKISNLRVIKGTALYTSAFKPPTEPLTNVTNTKLLCCNNSSTTGSTVTSGTITANGDPTASTDSPFDDLDGFKFGEEGDQNMIKTGSYIGNGSSTGPEINLGWEPQWVLTKNVGISDEWYIFDSMRGIVTGGDDPRLRPNSNGAESTGDQRLNLTPTGFKITSNNGDINGNGNIMIYMAIRRPDGYVAKPPEAGTDVFTLVNGVALANGNPNYISDGVRDFGIFRKPASTEGWNNFSRLTQKTNILLDTSAATTSLAVHMADFNNGMVEATGSDISLYQSWMWKRHAGFDVVTYKGNGTNNRKIPHSMGVAPEMMWVRKRYGGDWEVYHIGLGGGVNPQTYSIKLNESDAQAGTGSTRWSNTAPTSTHFTVSTNTLNSNNDDFIALHFASVNGISKIGYYTGDGSNKSVTTGFQPRFIIIRRVDYAEDWFVFDSVRGLTSGSADPYLRLNQTADQSTTASFFDISSTGFTVTANFTNNNVPYIYYAHA